jgi:hypothetical protein
MQSLSLLVIFVIGGLIIAIVISKVPLKHEKEHKLTNFKMLLKACFDDQFHALKLVEKEKQDDPSISDEEAAARALDKLLTKVRTQRNHQQSNNHFNTQ